MEEERVCVMCGIAKSLKDFPYRNKDNGTHHSYCLVCGRNLSKNHYTKNVQYYVRKAHVRRKELSDELNGKLYDYLEQHHCVDCGENDPIVLEFDHVRGEKAYNVSAMGYLFTSWESLLKEIIKCEVRCANCHRRKTAERLKSYRYVRRYGPLAQFG